MSSQRLAFVLVFTFCLAVPAAAQTSRRLQLQPIQPRQAKPGDTAFSALSVVPTDAFGFVSVKFSKLWDNPAAKPLRDWYAAQKQVPFEDMIGMKAGEIDRITVFKSSWDPSEGGPPIALVTTRKPYNEATILKALGADKGRPQLWRLTARRVFDLEGPMRHVAFLDDRTLLFIPESGTGKLMGVDLIAQLIVRKPDGPLASALAVAANHDITVGADMRGVEEFANLIQAARSKEVIPFLALLKARTVLFTVDVGQTAKCQFTLNFPDAESARRAGPVLEEGIKFVAGFVEKGRDFERDEIGKVIGGWLLNGLKSAKVATLGTNVTASADVPFADDLSKLVAALPKQFGVFRNETDATNNLKQLALALHNMHDAYGQFPGDVGWFIGEKNPPISWRVSILPFIEQDPLFKQLNPGVPWNDEANLKILAAVEMPKVFEIPGRPAPKNHTYFRILSLPKKAKGTDRPFFKEGVRGPKIGDVTDGLSNTLMIVEAEEAVPWYMADVFAYDGMLPLPKLGAKDADHFLAALGDGSVRAFKPSKLGEKTLRALITIRGGEVFELPK